MPVCHASLFRGDFAGAFELHTLSLLDHTLLPSLCTLTLADARCSFFFFLQMFIPGQHMVQDRSRHIAVFVGSSRYLFPVEKTRAARHVRLILAGTVAYALRNDGRSCVDDKRYF